jgi:hypothetical protein
MTNWACRSRKLSYLDFICFTLLMTDSYLPQANDNHDEPELDPEIEALLDFEPVPRRFKKEDGWTAPLQREFIAELARHGSPTRACEAVGKVRSGVDKLYKSPQAEGFRAAWDKAVELAERRRAAELRAEHSAVAGLKPPFVDHRRKAVPDPGPLPGQMLNEHGEWEDEESVRRRVEEAKNSISAKLLNCRRLYLGEIASSPGKRAAFEILTELSDRLGQGGAAGAAGRRAVEDAQHARARHAADSGERVDGRHGPWAGQDGGAEEGGGCSQRRRGSPAS